MKSYKYRAIAAALLMSVCCTGCSLSNLTGGESSAAETDFLDRRYDIEAIKEKAQALQKTVMQSDAEEEVDRAIAELLQAEDEAYAVYVRADMDYYANWNDESLAKLSDRTYEDFCVADEILTWAFCNAYQKSVYADQFAPYIDESWLEYYVANTLNRVISYARSSASSSGELLDDYYSTAYSDDVDPDNPSETNYTCAQLYLDTLASYDTSEYLYNYYSRDYSVEESSSDYQYLAEHLVPIYTELYDYLTADSRFRQIQTGGLSVEDPYATLQEFAPRLSPEIAESVEKLFSEQQYRAVSGDDCYDGSYTVALPGEQTALMYTYLAGDYYDLTTVVHEFGHFHSDWRDTTPVYLIQNCIDLAEVQSQSMEMLFTSFYGEIYGDDAEYVELLALYNIMDAVISGFAVGEFEYEVMQNLDDYSATEVCTLFNSIHNTCDLGIELYQITHLYEQPGYYISYGVSALAALQVYALMQEDMDSAVEKYTRISSLSSAAGDYQIVSGLAECGFDDIFEEATLAHLCDVLAARIEELK